MTPQWMIDDLAKSGLTFEDFPVVPLESEEQLKRYLGFTNIGNVPIIDVGGYFIPYPNVQNYLRLKLRREIIDSEGEKSNIFRP